ncbi:prepilin peptidase [Malaciobacter mytili LMG 24559]|uniref:Prepilin peptidase n=1 Tax=Malaciobacter mytili LMG 24559 TaxID=1032238 RepID=A0AAX2AHC8_9BACT|nr:prepilin peptidase [Malaciobacter mytili LMG 24559]
MGVFSFIIGLAFGSFLNVLIYRLPKRYSIITASCCPSCNYKIRWYENIPIFSYFYLKGFCSFCKQKISKRYLVVELLTAFVTLGLYLKFEVSIQLFFLMGLFYTLIVLSFIDLEYKKVPDYLLLVAFICSFFATDYEFFESLKYACLFAGFFILLEFILTFYIQNIKSRLLKDKNLRTQKALGEGDIPIIAIIGIVLGLKGGIIAIFLAGIFAIIPSIYNNFTKKDKQTAFIPFLMLGLFFEFFINISAKVFS